MQSGKRQHLDLGGPYGQIAAPAALDPSSVNVLAVAKERQD
jgi:hypothetical protein